MMTLTRTQSLTRIRTAAGIVSLIGIVAAIIGLLTDRVSFFHAYLVGFAFVALISLGCLFLLMINHVTGGDWSAPLQSLLAGGAQLIVVTAILFIPILFGLPLLYPWAQPENVNADTLLQHQSLFLNPPFFIIRALIYFAIWIILAWRMTRAESPKRTTAIIGLILYFPLVTLAAIDWFMSLEPHWYSTIYGVLFLASQALTAYAFALVLRMLMPMPAPEQADQQIRQDLGNVLLLILIVTGYLQFMQFLVVWSGNLPDEISWYLARTSGGWSWVALLLIMLNIVVPFVLLLSRAVKSRMRSLAFVALLILVTQFIYVYWLILPAFKGAIVDGITLLLPVGMCGLWLVALASRLRMLAEGAVADEP